MVLSYLLHVIYIFNCLRQISLFQHSIALADKLTQYKNVLSGIFFLHMSKKSCTFAAEKFISICTNLN